MIDQNVNRPSPSGAAVFLACVAAIFVPVILLASVLLFGSVIAVTGGDPEWRLTIFWVILLFGVPVAAAHVLTLWVPAYFILSRRRRLGWLEVAALGFVCGALPAFLLIAAEHGAAFQDSMAAHGAVFLVALFGACGLIGGLAFRLVLRADQARGAARFRAAPPVI